MSYRFIKELVIMKSKEYEVKYGNESNESNEFIKVLTKLIDEWINLKCIDKS
jgi:hypothetical protein